MYLTRRQLKRAVTISLFFVVCDCTMILIVAVRQIQESLMQPAAVQPVIQSKAKIRPQLHVTLQRDHVHVARSAPTAHSQSGQDDHGNTPNRTLEIGDKKSINVSSPKGKKAHQTESIHAPLYSDEIINPHPFQFTLQNSDACSRNGSDKNVFLLILVKCSAGAYFDRALIRKTWGSVTEVDNRRTLVMFVLGHVPNTSLNKNVAKEDAKYHDIIRGNFIDSYRNLTYKTRMAWRWASEFCPKAEYVANADADMLLNVHNIVRRLVNKPRQMYAEGNLRKNVRPVRSKKSKWFTPQDLYPEPTYAPFFTGACYVLSADVAAAVFRESSHVRFIPWEDVYLGLVLKKVGVRTIHVPGYVQYVNMRNDAAVRKSFLRGQVVLLDHQLKGVNPRYVKIWQAVEKQMIAEQKRSQIGQKGKH